MHMRRPLESYDVEVEVTETYLVTVSARTPAEAVDLASAEYPEGTISSTKVGEMKILDVHGD